MIFQAYPREIGLPRNVVHNSKEYFNFINFNNGKKTALYSSIYSFRLLKNNYKGVYETANVDKLFFDFDDKECDAYKECQKLHVLCKTKNLKHCIIMSGRGYHLYIFTTNDKLKYPKDAVKNGQMFFIDHINLKCDYKVVGDIARLARIPNTWHGIAKRFCIPLTSEQFEKGDTYIKTILSKKQNVIKNFFIGEGLFDLKKFDISTINKIENINITENFKINISGVDTISAPQCIQHLLVQPNMNYKQRYLLILYFKEKGYSKPEVFQILKKVLTAQKLKHCIKEERQLEYLFERDDLIFPCCEKINADGFCPGKCEKFNKIIYV